MVEGEIAVSVQGAAPRVCSGTCARTKPCLVLLAKSFTTSILLVGCIVFVGAQVLLRPSGTCKLHRCHWNSPLVIGRNPWILPYSSFVGWFVLRRQPISVVTGTARRINYVKIPSFSRSWIANTRFPVSPGSLSKLKELQPPEV